MTKWRHDKQRRRIHWGLLLVAIILLGAGSAAYWKINQPQKAASKKLQNVSVRVTPAAPAAPTTVVGRYMFTGTSYWARAIETEAHGDYNQPFSQLDTFHRDKYDAWQTDMECPITNNVVPYADQVKLLVFNCRPEFLNAFTKYFNIINLANNHTDNQGGITGLTETRNRLKDAGVQYLGTFDPAVASDICEIIALPVRLEETGKPETKGNLPVAFCAWHYVFRLPRPGEIDVMKKFVDTFPVFAFAHMGREYIPKADPVQEQIAHSIIDDGPEFLIANQSHWVQNTEVYKGKLIVYSTGNFIFDQLDAETNRGDNVAVNLSVKADDNVKKWLALGPSCFGFQDDCFAKAQAQGLKKVQLNLAYSVVVSQGGYKLLTHRADAATQAAVEQRMNWTPTCAQLSAPYSCGTNDGL